MRIWILRGSARPDFPTSQLSPRPPPTWRALPGLGASKASASPAPAASPPAGRSPPLSPAALTPGPGASTAGRPGLLGRSAPPHITARLTQGRRAVRVGPTPGPELLVPKAPLPPRYPVRAGLLRGLRGGARLRRRAGAPGPAAALNFGAQWGGGDSPGPSRPVGAHSNVPREQVAQAAAEPSPSPLEAPLPTWAGAHPGPRSGPPPAHPPYLLLRQRPEADNRAPEPGRREHRPFSPGRGQRRPAPPSPPPLLGSRFPGPCFFTAPGARGAGQSPARRPAGVEPSCASLPSALWVYNPISPF